MNNIASIFVIQEAYVDIICLQRKLMLKETNEKKDFQIMYLCYEILSSFA